MKEYGIKYIGEEIKRGLGPLFFNRRRKGLVPP